MMHKIELTTMTRLMNQIILFGGVI
uniref:Uncharacterized protein n=1 Tax=Rhizophora mucronata TaxID=61149 RepID=A0A2P2NMK1_RHIMU